MVHCSWGPRSCTDGKGVNVSCELYGRAGHTAAGAFAVAAQLAKGRDHRAAFGDPDIIVPGATVVGQQLSRKRPQPALGPAALCCIPDFLACRKADADGGVGIFAVTLLNQNHRTDPFLGTSSGEEVLAGLQARLHRSLSR